MLAYVRLLYVSLAIYLSLCIIMYHHLSLSILIYLCLYLYLSLFIYLAISPTITGQRFPKEPNHSDLVLCFGVYFFLSQVFSIFFHDKSAQICSHLGILYEQCLRSLIIPLNPGWLRTGFPVLGLFFDPQYIVRVVFDPRTYHRWKPSRRRKPGSQVEVVGFATASVPLSGTAPDFTATLDAGGTGVTSR